MASSKKITLSFAVLSLLGVTNGESYEQKQTRLEVRHTMNQGVGYDEGYTTLQSFWMTPEEYKGVYPYLDLRGHVFNRGKWAANVGVGLRSVVGSRIWGGNLYYDYRQVSLSNFNQFSFGFENLGMSWDFFANGYAVLGNQQSKLQAPSFAYFQGNSIYIKQQRYCAMSGADATARYHFLKNENYDLYADAAAYYYHPQNGTALFGGKLSLAANLLNYIFVKGDVSYDHVFKFIGQGVFGLSMPLGKSIESSSDRYTGDRKKVFIQRLAQYPNHNEIIVAKKCPKYSQAINPATGLPYFVTFVNNTSNSLGTYESPYPSLALAQANSNPYGIIYVYPGDGTTTNMSSGITLKDYQQFLGSADAQGLTTTQGAITIPAFSSVRPQITNTTNVIVTANGNVISGFYINVNSTSNGIYADTSNGLTVTNNTIYSSSSSDIIETFGLNLGLSSGGLLTGQYLIQNNEITSPLTGKFKGIRIYVYENDNSRHQATYIVRNNKISTPGNPIDFEVQDTGNNASVSTLIAQGNTMTTAPTVGGTGGKEAIVIDNHGTSVLTFDVSNNIVTQGERALYLSAYNNSQSIGVLTSNTMTTSVQGIRLEGRTDPPDQASVKATITGNTLYGNASTKAGEINASVLVINKTDKYANTCVAINNNAADSNTTVPTYGYYISSATTPIVLTSFLNNTGSTSFTNVLQQPTCN